MKYWPACPAAPSSPTVSERARPEWFAAFLADRGTRKPSAHTLKAYRQDFDAIATLLADGEDLSGMALTALTVDTLRTAFARYAETHEAASIQRCWSTWNVLCTYLYTAELIGSNPMSMMADAQTAKTLPSARRSSPRNPISRSSSPRKALLLNVTSTLAGESPQPLVDQIGRGRTVTVVDTDVADATTARHIGDKGDHRDALGAEPVDRLGHQVGVGGLHDHPVRPAGSDLVQGFHHRRHRPGFAGSGSGPPQVPAPAARPPSRLECVRKPLRRLHDNIDQILASGQPQLGALLVEVTDGLLDFAPGGLAHIGSLCSTRSTVASLNPTC